MPATAADYGLKNSYNVPDSIDAAARYVRKAMNQFGGRLDLVWASYNAGFGAVEAYQTGRTLRPKGGKVINPRGLKTGGIPPYRETRDYVAICWKVYGAAKNSASFARRVGEDAAGVAGPADGARITRGAPAQRRGLPTSEARRIRRFSIHTRPRLRRRCPRPTLTPAFSERGRRRRGRTAAVPLEEVFYASTRRPYLVRGGEIVEPIERIRAGGRAAP